MYGTDLMIGKTFPAEFVFALFTIMEFVVSMGKVGR